MALITARWLSGGRSSRLTSTYPTTTPNQRILTVIDSAARSQPAASRCAGEVDSEITTSASCITRLGRDQVSGDQAALTTQSFREPERQRPRPNYRVPLSATALRAAPIVSGNDSPPPVF